jgi:hypothetical protein
LPAVNRAASGAKCTEMNYWMYRLYGSPGLQVQIVDDPCRWDTP